MTLYHKASWLCDAKSSRAHGVPATRRPRRGRIRLLVEMAVVTMAWATIESALGDGRAAPEIIAALSRSSAAEISELSRRIGVGNAGRLLLQARSAHAAERRAKLTACLAVLDKAVAAGGRPPHSALAVLRLRHSDQASRYRDVAQCALLATLIDIELGGALEARRSRFAAALTALESHFAAMRRQAPGQDTETYVGQARGVFLRVGGLARGDDI